MRFDTLNRLILWDNSAHRVPCFRLRVINASVLFCDRLVAVRPRLAGSLVPSHVLVVSTYGLLSSLSLWSTPAIDHELNAFLGVLI